MKYDVQVANKPKKGTTPILIRKMQLKIPKYHYTPVGKAISPPHPTIPIAGEFAEQQILSFLTGRNSKW